MQAIFNVLSMVWHFFTDVTCPFMGISFAALFLGIMVVRFSLTLLKPLLGIGGSIAKGAERQVGRRRISRNDRKD